jgi:hypothetical protein
VSSANAGGLEPSDFSPGFSGASSNLLENNDEINLTTLSKFSQISQFNSATDSAPPAFWIMGLGLCLVLLGYKMKTKAGKREE